MARPSQLLYRVYENRLSSDLNRTRLPRHLGIILDGHRRYARSEGMTDYSTSYRAGMQKFEDVIGWAEDLAVPAITGWVLSKENLTRPAVELDPYFEVLIELFERLPELAQRHGFSVGVIGSLDLLPDDLVAAAKKAGEESPSGPLHLTIAMGYGGRQEIVDACRDVVTELADQGVPADRDGRPDRRRRSRRPHVPPRSSRGGSRDPHQR